MKKARLKKLGIAIGWILLLPPLTKGAAAEALRDCPCEDWRIRHPEWIWCDDFEERRVAMEDKYFEYGDDDGDFIPVDGVGVGGSRGMRVRFQAGEVGAGGFKKSFGRTPSAYIGRRAERPNDDFQEVYWRMWLRLQPGWTGGGGAKLSRATVLATEGWAQGMIAHLWSGGPDDAYLLIDPATGISTDGALVSTRYNDFSNLRWLGYQRGSIPLFHDDRAGEWHCIEAHAKLNAPGASDGVFEYWIDDQLQTRKDGLNWHGDWNARRGRFMINAVFFENYWNAGSPVEQERYFDNIVISASRIGCGCDGVDSDRDHIPDEAEARSTAYQVGVDDRLVDSDGDGASNAEEFLAGTDPVDADSALTISGVEAAGNQLTIRFQSVPSGRYLVQRTVRILSGDWETVASVAVTGPGGTQSVSVLQPSLDASFYRVAIQ